MPSTLIAPSAPESTVRPATAGRHGDGAAAQLAQACGTLWLATLSLMTAFMQTQAPAHRLLMARRIAANLRTLSGQPCFDAKTRATFERLGDRWAARADRAQAAQDRPGGGGLLRALWPSAAR